MLSSVALIMIDWDGLSDPLAAVAAEIGSDLAPEAALRVPSRLLCNGTEEEVARRRHRLPPRTHSK